MYISFNGRQEQHTLGSPSSTNGNVGIYNISDSYVTTFSPSKGSTYNLSITVYTSA